MILIRLVDIFLHARPLLPVMPCLIHRSQKKRSSPSLCTKVHMFDRPEKKPSTSPSQHHQAHPGHLGGGDGLANASTTLPGVQAVLTTGDSVGLLDNLLSLGEDQLDVAGVGHVRVDLDHSVSKIARGTTHCSSKLVRMKRTRPWAR